MRKDQNLTFLDVCTLGIGGAVGSGIFVLLGSGIAYTGRSIVLAVVLGCGMMLLAYFYNVLMSSMFIFPGGDYSQKAFLFGPYMTGVSGLFSVIGTVGTALYGMTIVSYLGLIFPGILTIKKLAAIVVLTLFFIASIKGVHFISRLNNLLTAILLLAIGAFILWGLPQVKGEVFQSAGFFKGGRQGFSSAIAIMAWACLGTTMGPIAVSSVTKDAKRTIPQAIVLITIVIAVLYGLMATVAVGVLPEMSEQALSEVSKAIFPYGIYVLFILGGGVMGIATTLISILLTMGEPIQQVAEDGWLPKVFLKRTAKGFPWATRLMFYLCGILPIIFNVSLEAIVSLITIPMMLINAYLNLSCLRLVRNYPDQWRRSIFYMRKMCLFLLSLLACGCSLFVAYYLFSEQDLPTKGLIAGIIGGCLTR